MINKTQYTKMLRKFRNGQITEAQWVEFCQTYLMSQPVWLGVVKRLRLK
jgi:hypothetical protein